MKVLCKRELAYISGGNAQDTVYGNPGATSSNPSTWGPSYWASSESYGYAEGGPICTTSTVVTTAQNYVTTKTSPGCVVTSNPPFISCSVGMPSTTNTTSGGVTTTITCVTK